MNYHNCIQRLKFEFSWFLDWSQDLGSLQDTDGNDTTAGVTENDINWQMNRWQQRLWGGQIDLGKSRTSLRRNLVECFHLNVQSDGPAVIIVSETNHSSYHFCDNLISQNIIDFNNITNIYIYTMKISQDHKYLRTFTLFKLEKYQLQGKYLKYPF